jgi:hypothetical protein
MNFVIEPNYYADVSSIDLDRIPPIPPCPCAYGEINYIING